MLSQNLNQIRATDLIDQIRHQFDSSVDFQIVIDTPHLSEGVETGKLSFSFRTERLFPHPAQPDILDGTGVDLSNFFSTFDTLPNYPENDAQVVFSALSNGQYQFLIEVLTPDERLSFNDENLDEVNAIDRLAIILENGGHPFDPFSLKNL